MRFGYVVLYVVDPERCRRFWVEQIGMVVKKTTEAGGFAVAQVGFADQDAALELVPLALMRDNPDGLDLATPSMCFHAADLDKEHARLRAAGVEVSEINEHCGTRSFAFSDPEDRWFAITAPA